MAAARFVCFRRAIDRYRCINRYGEIEREIDGWMDGWIDK